MSGVEWLFWCLLFVGIYPYAIYPVLVRVLGAVRRQKVETAADYLPRVTVITAAYNEARHIEATILNKFEQDYPANRLDMIVVSDGSEDGTDEIVARLAEQLGRTSDGRPRLRLIRQTPRQGKTAGLNRAILEATGDIVVFADANSIYRRTAVHALVRNFADPRVGYATGKMLYVNPDGSLVGDGCSAFMRYENVLRAAETRAGSVVGVDGGVDAVRKILYVPMRADQLPDFVLPLNVVEQGFRVVFEPEAILTEDTLTNNDAEYRMRVRVALRAFWALWDKRNLLNPLRTGVFAWQLWSHKLLRYLSFLPLGIAAVLNWWLLAAGSMYALAAVGQLIFAACVLGAMFGPRALGERVLVRYCFYFFLLNWASAVAWVRFLRGQKQVLWQPRTG